MYLPLLQNKLNKVPVVIKKKYCVTLTVVNRIVALVTIYSWQIQQLGVNFNVEYLIFQLLLATLKK